MNGNDLLTGETHYQVHASNIHSYISVNIEGIIVQTGLSLGRFHGQPIGKLKDWLYKIDKNYKLLEQLNLKEREK